MGSAFSVTDLSVSVRTGYLNSNNENLNLMRLDV